MTRAPHTVLALLLAYLLSLADGLQGWDRPRFSAPLGPQEIGRIDQEVTLIAGRERKEFQRPPEPFDWRLAFIEPWKMRTFVYTLAMYLLAFVAMDTVSSIVVYYMKNYLLRGGEANFVSGTRLVAQVASLPFYVWLSKRTSKRTGYLVGATIWIVTMLTGFFIAPGQPSFVVYLFATAVGLGTGGMTSKLSAADLARHSGATVVIANGAMEQVIPRIVLAERLTP